MLFRMNNLDFIAGIEPEYLTDTPRHPGAVAPDRWSPTVDVLTPVGEDLNAPSTHFTPSIVTHENPLSPWHPRLAFDVALGEDREVLYDRYNLSPNELDSLYLTAAFRREVAEHGRSIREEGVTFRQKAKVQAEMYLEVLDDIVNDVEVSAATRLDAIKSVVKWGDLEPKVDKTAGNVMPQFNIQINL